MNTSHLGQATRRFRHKVCVFIKDVLLDSHLLRVDAEETMNLFKYIDMLNDTQSSKYGVVVHQDTFFDLMDDA